MTSNYSVNVYNGSTLIFSGTFTTETSTGVVQSFYETDVDDISTTNVLLHVGSYSSTFGDNDNIYYSSTGYFSSNGVAVLVDSGSEINSLFNSYYGSDITYMILYNNSYGPNVATYIYLQGTDVSDANFTYRYAVTADDAPCFNEGTKILCLNKNFGEKYVPIEKLRKGDIVKSYKHGYRKIDLIGKGIMINNSNINNNRMYKMIKTEKNGLIKDLLVTGGHSILVDDLGSLKEENEKIIGEVKIDDKYLLLASVSKDFIKIKENKEFTYYHFVLENNGDDNERFGVWANGILTETTSKNHFVNHKYTLL
jgi:hypothetical protein